MTRPEYHVEGGVLSWMRRTSGLDEAEAASALGVPQEVLKSWEDGKTTPSVTKVRLIAKTYGRPLSAVFLPNAPQAELMPNDFRPRTVGGAPPRITKTLILAVRQALDWRDGVTELAEEDDKLLPHADIPAVDRSANPASLGETFRQKSGFSYDDQLFLQSDAVFRTWREIVEEHGILVFLLGKKTLPRESCRAFSLWGGQDPPVIALSRDDTAPVAHSFSLLHEYAHLMLGQQAICAEREGTWEGGAVEGFCNRFAASALMPTTLMNLVLDEPFPNYANRHWSMKSIGDLARRLSVSRPALALRLEHLGAAAPGLYEWVEQQIASEPKPSKKSGGGAKWPQVRVNERGNQYCRTIFLAWTSGLISLAGAAEMLNVRTHYVPALDYLVGSERRV